MRAIVRTRPDTWLMATVLSIAAVALGVAVQLNNGTYTPEALTLVTLAFACCFAAVVAPSARFIERGGDQPAILILGAGLALQLALVLTSSAGMYLHGGPDVYGPHHVATAIAAVLAGAGLSHRPWLGRARMPLLFGVYLFLGVWMIKASPHPHIDVVAWHEETFRVLSQHQNPYAATMPNIYGFTSWYADGLATPTRVLVGFPYPPLSLFLAWLGEQWGDYRYAMLASITLTAIFFAYARPGRLGETIAAIFLFTPRGLFVLEQGWTEPLVVLFMAATVFCACRIPKALPLSFGLFLAIKQYSIFLIPIAGFLLGPGRSWKKYALLITKSGFLAAVLTIPLALWNLRAFISSVILFQGKQPFRGDALSYLAWSARDGVPRLPLWTGFAIAIVALGLAAWRAPRTPAGFAASAAVVFFSFFAFAKQAFCNYYFMILGAICCAVAALHSPFRTKS